MSSFWIARLIGVPSVLPSKTPLRMRTVSDSLRCVTRWLCPGARRSRSGWMSASDIGRSGGHPSMTAPIAAPWDSPHVVTRKSWPNVLPMGRSVGRDDRWQHLTDPAAQHDVGEMVHRGRIRVHDDHARARLLGDGHDAG